MRLLQSTNQPRRHSHKDDLSRAVSALKQPPTSMEEELGLLALLIMSLHTHTRTHTPQSLVPNLAFCRDT